MVRVLVCGYRRWKDRAAIERELRQYPPDTVVIQGDNGQAERTAAEVARSLGLNVETYPPDWHKYGQAAIPIRNDEMLSAGQPDIVLAFHADLRTSKVTLDMVRRAERAGVPVQVLTV